MSFFSGDALKNYPDVLDVKQVRDILKAGESVVYQLLKENKIANLRVGRKTIIAKSSVINYLNSLFEAKEQGEINEQRSQEENEIKQAES